MRITKQFSMVYHVPGLTVTMYSGHIRVCSFQTWGMLYGEYQFFIHFSLEALNDLEVTKYWGCISLKIVDILKLKHFVPNVMIKFHLPMFPVFTRKNHLARLVSLFLPKRSDQILSSIEEKILLNTYFEMYKTLLYRLLTYLQYNLPRVQLYYLVV